MIKENQLITVDNLTYVGLIQGRHNYSGKLGRIDFTLQCEKQLEREHRVRCKAVVTATSKKMVVGRPLFEYDAWSLPHEILNQQGNNRNISIKDIEEQGEVSLTIIPGMWGASTSTQYGGNLKWGRFKFEPGYEEFGKAHMFEKVRCRYSRTHLQQADDDVVFVIPAQSIEDKALEKKDFLTGLVLEAEDELKSFNLSLTKERLNEYSYSLYEYELSFREGIEQLNDATSEIDDKAKQISNKIRIIESLDALDSILLGAYYDYVDDKERDRFNSATTVGTGLKDSRMSLFSLDLIERLAKSPDSKESSDISEYFSLMHQIYDKIIEIAPDIRWGHSWEVTGYFKSLSQAFSAIPMAIYDSEVDPDKLLKLRGLALTALSVIEKANINTEIDIGTHLIEDPEVLFMLLDDDFLETLKPRLNPSFNR